MRINHLGGKETRTLLKLGLQPDDLRVDKGPRRLYFKTPLQQEGCLSPLQFHVTD